MGTFKIGLLLFLIGCVGLVFGLTMDDTVRGTACASQDGEVSIGETDCGAGGVAVEGPTDNDMKEPVIVGAGVLIIIGGAMGLFGDWSEPDSSTASSETGTSGGSMSLLEAIRSLFR